MKIKILLSVMLLCFSPAKSQTPVNLELVSDKLISPIGMVAPNDGSGRLFILEQRGLIYILGKNKELLATPFLDLKQKVVKLKKEYDERGLLGLAFHPKYKENGRFFVYYSSNLDAQGNDHIAILSEFKTDPKNPNKALLNEKVLLKIEQPEWNHNGGQILFDAKGLMYLGLGDGGSGGDPHGEIGNGQNKNTILGKIIRINVDGVAPYTIPEDNPFKGKDEKAEIFAYGLRNPWRFSIDKVTGRLFCGDVGQHKYEEVNIIEKGKNYGWRIMEGNHCFKPEQDCDKTGLVLPITEYDRSEGLSVTGGYVYRGKMIPKLYGKYVFADWKSMLFVLTEQPDKTWQRTQLKPLFPEFKTLNINSFGEDVNGELYILTQTERGPFSPTGKIFKIKD